MEGRAKRNARVGLSLLWVVAVGAGLVAPWIAGRAAASRSAGRAIAPLEAASRAESQRLAALRIRVGEAERQLSSLIGQLRDLQDRSAASSGQVGTLKLEIAELEASLTPSGQATLESKVLSSSRPPVQRPSPLCFYYFGPGNYSVGPCPSGK